ncbi:MAG: rod shape-determining protein MreD [Verrucomicrobiia bacterium]
MNYSHTIFLVIIGYLAIALEATLFATIRGFTGINLDPLPAIIACSGLLSPIETIILVSLILGFMFDSISANPLGITAISLAIPGLLIHLGQGILVKKEWQTQFLSGVFAGALQPFISLFLLITMRYKPIFSVDSVFLISISAVICGFITPGVFKFLNWMDTTFNYSRVKTSSFRQDREIKRGRDIK